jgi:hypothetical protein
MPSTRMPKTVWVASKSAIASHIPAIHKMGTTFRVAVELTTGSYPYIKTKTQEMQPNAAKLQGMDWRLRYRYCILPA